MGIDHADVPATGTGIALDLLRSGASMGVGSLPHRDAHAAAQFSLDAFDVLSLPSLPRRSPAEAAVAQVVVGAQGITVGPYGSLAVDTARLDPDAPVSVAIGHDRFAGFRVTAERAAARGVTGPVKWQLAGPLSVGAALERAGASSDVAFAVAVATVTAHLTALRSAIADILPGAPQIVILNEPDFGQVLSADSPLSPNEAIDLLSSAMAAIDRETTVGVHACRHVDVPGLLAAGPTVLSVPVGAPLAQSAMLLQRFVERGGWTVWGAVATDGPVGDRPDRAVARLQHAWRELANRGVDVSQLRARSLVSPECGLGSHSTPVAERLVRLTRSVAQSIAL